MAIEALPQLQENKLQRLEALIDSYHFASPDGTDDEAAMVADFFVDEGIGVRQSSTRLWDYYWTKALAGGVSANKERAAKILDLLERGGRIIQRSAAIARAYADLSGHQVARLVHFEEQSREFASWVKECRARSEMLERPRKPLNREQIAESQAAYRRGEGEAVFEIIGRLEKGGPLVKE